MREAICLLSCLLLFSCHRHPALHPRDPLEDAFILAKKEHKKVFVLITNSQCGTCAALVKRIDTTSATRRILRDNYICYTVDVLDTTQNRIAQIVKCPSWPFPYFFDSDGTLDAFGFPAQEQFDIHDLSKIGIDEDRFKELFGLPISTARYKEMVSLTMRAWLLAGNHRTGADAEDSAYHLVRRSLDIAVYPFNLYLAQSLARRRDPSDLSALEQFRQSQIMRNDPLTYGHLLDSIGWKRDNNANN